MTSIGAIALRLQRLERLVAGLPAECSSLWDDLQHVKQHVSRGDAALATLSEEAEAQRVDRLRLVESLTGERRRHAETARRLAVLDRLHSTLDRARMLQALEDVVASLVGCQELAVFELVGPPPALVAIHCVGVAQGALEVVRLGDDVIGRALAAGEIFLADDEGGGDRSALRLSACVPLVADGRVTGALALFRMREPKARLDEGDLELLRLLGAHGGTALLATRAVSERGLR